MQSFNDPIDGTNAGSGSGSTGGGGTTGGTGGLGGGTTGGGTGGTEGTAGGYGGSTGGAGTTGTGGLGGGTTDGGTGGFGAGTTAGTTGGFGGSTGGTGETGGAGDDFDVHEPAYRRHYTTVGTETAGTTGTYDEARTGYAAGHAAASNPAYADRPYEEVEVDIERSVGSERFGRVREFARHAYEWKGVIAGVALAAAGGYWASRKLASAASELSEEEERDCRTYYDTHAARSTGVPYSQARTVYVLGYVAGRNPEYAGRTYDDVEPHLRAGYTGRRAGNYDALRDFGRRGYERGSARGSV
jgi:hypothetical protein